MIGDWVETKILTLTVIEGSLSHLDDPRVKKELFDFWSLCKTAMTKVCSGTVANTPDLNPFASCFIIRDSRQQAALFAFRIFLPSFSQHVANALDDESRLALQAHYAVVQFSKVNPAIENNAILRNQLYEIFVAALYFYCTERGVERLATQISPSIFVNKQLLRMGFVQKRRKVGFDVAE